MLCLVAALQAPQFTQVWSTRLQTEIQSLVIGERAIYFGTNDSYGALDQTTGKKIWARSLGQGKLGCLLAIADETVFISVGQGDLIAVQASTGKPIWNLRRNGYASPIGAYNQAIYASLLPGKVTAISAQTGKPLWTGDLIKSEPSTKPIRFGKHIFVGTKSGSIIAFDKDTGAVGWRFKERPASVQSLLVGDDRLMTLYDDGAIIGLSLETGQRMWAVYTFNGLFGVPLYRDGRLYVTSVGGNFYSIAGQTGEQLLKRSVSSLQNFGLSQPMPFRDGFLIADRAKLVFLSAEGEKQWEVDTKSDLFGQQPRPLGDDVILTGSHEIRRVRLN